MASSATREFSPRPSCCSAPASDATLSANSAHVWPRLPCMVAVHPGWIWTARRIGCVSCIVVTICAVYNGTKEKSPMGKVFVAGVGITKFEKPFTRDWEFPDMAREAGCMALADAGIGFDAVEQACVGYVFGDSTCGQRAVYELGLTGIPIYNVNNNCSTGSTALFLAKQLVEGGLADCVLALGFEKMQKGSLGSTFNDRTNPMDKHITAMIE